MSILHPRRLAQLPIFTILGATLAVGALIAITAMAARAAAPPNLAKALDSQRQLTSTHPNDAAAWNDLGNLLVMAHQPNEAETAYRHAVELDAHRTSAMFNLGLLLQQQRSYGEAKNLYEKVVALEPNHAWAHYQLGTLHERKSEKARAIREYATAFALDPQLAFREVNPQVVENGLVTESLLRAYQRRSVAGEAPEIYDEPSRIRDLLLRQPKDADRTADANDARQPPPAVLRQKDLPTGNVGQATPAAGTKPNAPQAPPPTRTAPGGYSGAGVPGVGVPGSRNWTRPNPNPSADGSQPGVVVTPPPNGLYYRPSVPSTGRLDTQVVPQENA